MLCRITSPSLRTNRLVETPTAAVCGAIGLPTSAPTELNDGKSSSGRFSSCPVTICTGPNIAFVQVLLHRTEHRVGRGFAARQRAPPPAEDRCEHDERDADLRAAVGHRARHAAEHE